MTLEDWSRKPISLGCSPTMDDLTTGCLQRIATAAEKMAENYNALVADRDRARRSSNYYQERCDQYARRCWALRGVITKMKKKAEA